MTVMEGIMQSSQVKCKSFLAIKVKGIKELSALKQRASSSQRGFRSLMPQNISWALSSTLENYVRCENIVKRTKNSASVVIMGIQIVCICSLYLFKSCVSPSKNTGQKAPWNPWCSSDNQVRQGCSSAQHQLRHGWSISSWNGLKLYWYAGPEATAVALWLWLL